MTGDLRGPLNPILPQPVPQPAPDCAACADLARQRAKASAEQDYSLVSDCNVKLRAHPRHPISR